MALSQLTPAQREAVTRLAFGPSPDLHVQDGKAKEDELGFMKMMRRYMGESRNSDYRTEPTEAMPNGLPSDGFVELKFRSEPVAKMAGDVPSFLGGAALGADELAMFKLFKEDPNMAQASAMMPQIDQLHLGQREVYDFRFTVAPRVYMEKSLHDDKVTDKSPIVKVANLPADFQKQIDQRLAALKKLPFFDPAFMGGNRGAVPPNP